MIVTLLGHGVNLGPTIFVGCLPGHLGHPQRLIIVFGKLTRSLSRSGPISPAPPIVNIYLTSAQTPLGSSLAKWGQSNFLGLPSVFWVMAIFISVSGYYLRHSRIGQKGRRRRW